MGVRLRMSVIAGDYRVREEWAYRAREDRLSDVIIKMTSMMSNNVMERVEKLQMFEKLINEDISKEKWELDKIKRSCPMKRKERINALKKSLERVKREREAEQERTRASSNSSSSSSSSSGSSQMSALDIFEKLAQNKIKFDENYWNMKLVEEKGYNLKKDIKGDRELSNEKLQQLKRMSEELERMRMEKMIITVESLPYWEMMCNVVRDDDNWQKTFEQIDLYTQKQEERYSVAAEMRYKGYVAIRSDLYNALHNYINQTTHDFIYKMWVTRQRTSVLKKMRYMRIAEELMVSLDWFE